MGPQCPPAHPHPWRDATILPMWWVQRGFNTHTHVCTHMYTRSPHTSHAQCFASDPLTPLTPAPPSSGCLAPPPPVPPSPPSAPPIQIPAGAAAHIRPALGNLCGAGRCYIRPGATFRPWRRTPPPLAPLPAGQGPALTPPQETEGPPSGGTVTPPNLPQPDVGRCLFSVGGLRAVGAESLDAWDLDSGRRWGLGC